MFPRSSSPENRRMKKLKQSKVTHLFFLTLLLCMSIFDYGSAVAERDTAFSVKGSRFTSIANPVKIVESGASIVAAANIEGKSTPERRRPFDPAKIRTTPSRLPSLAPPGQPVPSHTVPKENALIPPGPPMPMSREGFPGSPETGSEMSSPMTVSGGPVHVKLGEGVVQVLAENSSFGEVMNAMAREMGFRLKIPSDLSGKRVSISLYDVPVDRAIIRLFSLVQEKNYKVKYSKGGQVTNVEVVEVKISAETPSAMPGGNQKISPSVRRQPERRYQPYRPPAVRPSPRSLPSRPPANTGSPMKPPQ